MVDGPASYHPGDSRLHRLHPVTKVVLVACFVVGGYLATVELRAIMAVVLLAGAVSAGVGTAVLRASLPILAPLLVGLLVIQGLVVEGDGTVAASLGPVTIWRSGLFSGAAFFGILAVFVLAGLLFVTVTHPKRLAVALYQNGVPYKLGYVFVTALQLIPDLQARGRRILAAQRSRGLRTGGSLRHRLRALVALLSPLVIGALVSTQTRSLALEARGFSMPGPRSSLYAPTESRLDHSVRLLGIAGVGALVVWNLL